MFSVSAGSLFAATAFAVGCSSAFQATTGFRAGPSLKVFSPGSSTRLFNTWSNGQAIKEYQDFLETGNQDVELKRDRPSIIVTPLFAEDSRLVDAVVALGEGEDALIKPGTPMPEEYAGQDSFPIYICVPPSELDEFLNYLPDEWKAKMSDFVFFSGGKLCGCIEPTLKRYGLARDTMTQALASGFTMPGPTGKPQDLAIKIGSDAGGEDKWAGESAVCGQWQGAFAERLARNGIRVRTGFYRDWRRYMWERAAYDAVFNLVGAVRGEPTTIREVANYYPEEVSDMLWEVSSTLRGTLAVTLTYGFEERLFGVGENSDEGLCEVNDAVYPHIFDNPMLTSKMILQYLNFAKDEVGLLENVELPPSQLDRPSSMRQGNLRSDGVI
jgi:hypothetical protein